MYHEPLTIPTDVEIMKLLSNGNRQTPANVAAHLDHDPGYMSERLRNLEKREYIRDAPPAERSGMYELTKLGKIVAFHIHTYVRGYHNIFHAKSEIILEEQPEKGFYPDLTKLDDTDLTALAELDITEGMTVPSHLEFEIVVEREFSPQTTAEALFSLHYHGLAERIDGMDVYQITERGERVAELYRDGVREPTELTERLRETYSDDEKDRLDILS